MDMEVKIDNVGWGNEICFYICQNAIDDLTCRCFLSDTKTKVNVDDQQHKEVINRRNYRCHKGKFKFCCWLNYNHVV